MTDTRQSACLLVDRQQTDDLCHITDDGITALCGTDVASRPWCECPDGVCLLRPECAVCADLDHCEENR